MRVLSGLADLDFHMGRITREGNRLRVESRPDSGIATVVYVEPADVVAGLRALLRSPRALLFIITAPLRRSRASGSAPGAASPGVPKEGTSTSQDLNNPWI